MPALGGLGKTMDEYQGMRIAIGGAIIAFLPCIPRIICYFLGDCEQSKKSSWFAIGKKLGKATRWLVGAPRKNA